MKCINGDCNEELESGAEFCPFCGTDQVVTTQAWTPTATTQSTSTMQASPVRKDIGGTSAGQMLEMRASEGVWHFAETERYVAPGERRPLVIRDEQVVHLAHTDRILKPEELLERVTRILEAQSVPVDVQLVRARWMNDSREERPRLVAQLRNHPYSDIKIIMGVDYMGKWASIQLHLASELQPAPRPPEPVKTPMNPGPLLLLGGGGFLLFLAFASGAAGSPGATVLFGFLGFCGLVAGVIWLVVAQTAQATKATQQREQWQREQQRQAYEKAAERLARTFKVDDMQLFCTAMRAVFQAVVDDIVQQGGEVVRVEGGKGGFFEGQSAEAGPTPRQADAATSGV